PADVKCLNFLYLYVGRYPRNNASRNSEQTPLLSCSDVRKLMIHFLPKRDVTTEEVMRQMKARHRKREAGIECSYKNQDNQSLAFRCG
ncbi:MAG: hypothetical protein BECKG1743D_GA0114223_106981, partial [Candidatus Kentron sp. G]